MRVTLFLKRWAAVLLGGVLLLSLPACDSGNAVDIPGNPRECTLDASLLADGGVGKDGIPALSDPEFVDASEVNFLDGSNRVIGLLVEGQPLAVPHNILWWHEIINFNVATVSLAVTYCPLTGSSMAFDRASIGGGEFGVSGLLFQNNLTMYDRTNDESLWPQMSREAGCGPRTGAQLTMLPVMEMTWDGWKTLYPDTRVVSDETGFLRNYTPTGYPYGNYEVPGNGSLLFPLQIDGRREPKERILGIPDGDGGGMAFPFFELDAEGPFTAVHRDVGGLAVVVFWDRARQGAMAFRPRAAGQDLTFEARQDGLFDTQTGSRWRLDGLAEDGVLAGERLEPVADAYVAFWFAWALFQPQTRLWQSVSASPPSSDPSPGR